MKATRSEFANQLNEGYPGVRVNFRDRGAYVTCSNEQTDAIVSQAEAAGLKVNGVESSDATSVIRIFGFPRRTA